MSDRSGRVHPGDKILAINGQDISTSGQDSVHYYKSVLDTMAT